MIHLTCPECSHVFKAQFPPRIGGLVGPVVAGGSLVVCPSCGHKFSCNEYIGTESPGSSSIVVRLFVFTIGLALLVSFIFILLLFFGLL